jgi:hypothetical protein
MHLHGWHKFVYVCSLMNDLLTSWILIDGWYATTISFWSVGYCCPQFLLLVWAPRFTRDHQLKLGDRAPLSAGIFLSNPGWIRTHLALDFLVLPVMQESEAQIYNKNRYYLWLLILYDELSIAPLCKTERTTPTQTPCYLFLIGTDTTVWSLINHLWLKIGDWAGRGPSGPIPFFFLSSWSCFSLHPCSFFGSWPALPSWVGSHLCLGLLLMALGNYSGCWFGLLCYLGWSWFWLDLPLLELALLLLDA